MAIGNLFVIIFFAYYTKYLFSLVNKNRRGTIQGTNKKLDELRKVKVKTLKQQKEFMDTKFPKPKKFNWTFRSVLSVIWNLAVFIAIVRFYMYLFSYFNWEISLWTAIIIIMISPILINIVLQRTNLQRSDITVFFR